LRPLSEKFDQLESLLLHHRAILAQNTGVPFLRLVYRPDEEEACRHRREVLARVLEGQGTRVETVSCKGAIFGHYERRGRLTRLFELEKENSDWLAGNIGPHARREMVDRLLAAVDRLGDDGVLFVVDVAFGYPYLSLAGVLHDVTNRIQSPMALVLFYPGEVTSDGQIQLLGRRASGTYRTRDLV
jgi:hypothetical protein